jgi:hypothetical protein
MAIRYLSHYYVDYADKTTVLSDTNVGTDGKTHPIINGLDVKFWDVDSAGIDYCLSVVHDDAAVIPEVAGIEVMEFNTWAERVQIYFDKFIANNNLADQNFSLDKTSLDTIENSFASVYSYISEQTTAATE